MSYELIIADMANYQLKVIIEYMCNKLYNEQAAKNFIDKLQEKYNKVSTNPYIYEASRDTRLEEKGYRKIVIDNYVIMYVVNEDKKEIYINGIFCVRQNYERYL